MRGESTPYTSVSRRLRRFGLCAVVLFAGVSGIRDTSGAPRTKVANPAYPPEFQTRVRKAIERGVEYMRAKQLAGQAGTPAGGAEGDARDYEEAAAVSWVLRRAGLGASDPALKKCAARLGRRPPRSVDEAALALLAACARPLPEGNPFGAKLPDLEGVVKPLPEEERPRVEKLVKFIVDRQVKQVSVPGLESALQRFQDSRGGWGREDRQGRFVDADIPTICLALLALEAAIRAGVEVPQSAHLAVVGLLLGWQAEEGPKVALTMNEVRGADRYEWTERAVARGFGFTGTQRDKPTGYFTVAGALGLVLCQDALQEMSMFQAGKEGRKKTSAAIRDALAWVQENYDVTRNPVGGTLKKGEAVDEKAWHHAWLHGLARLALHARMRFVGAHDWYQEGAEDLMARQASDGSWFTVHWSHDCYALLFLMRTSLPALLPVTTPSESR